MALTQWVHGEANMAASKMLVALKDLEHVETLTALACELAERRNAEVVALHVVVVGPQLPLSAPVAALDTQGEGLLARAREVAAKSPVKQISTRLIRARDAAHALVREAEDEQAELMILGYQHGLGAAKAVMGSVVRHVSEHAPCQVIVQVVPATQRAKEVA